MNDFESLIEEVEALESFMDELESDLALDVAIESCTATEADEEGGAGDAPATKASGLSAKLRGAFNKLAGAFKRGDKKAAERAVAEITVAAGELEDATDSADEEGKKKLGVAAKIGIAAGAAVLLTAGLTATGKAMEKGVATKIASGEGVSKAAKLMVTGANKVLNAMDAVNSKIAIGKDVRAKAADRRENRQVNNSFYGAAPTKRQAKKMKNDYEKRELEINSFDSYLK